MRIIFKKSHLPFLKPALKHGSGRDLWNVARLMQDENGLQHQLPAEIMLLERGVEKNDIWSMCELARTYFYHCGDIFLPMALRLWMKAAKEKDTGALYDLNNLPVLDRIYSYRSFDGNTYKEIEMKCAMLTEMYLHRGWETDWNKLDMITREERCKTLMKVACRILQIPEIEVLVIPNLKFENQIVDGLAGFDNKITLRKEVLDDLERLVEVIFHELAHEVCFEIMRGTSLGIKLKEIYGVTDERIASWREGKMGYEVPTSEEDPDTLSYGVYTLWATFFLS